MIPDGMRAIPGLVHGYCADEEGRIYSIYGRGNGLKELQPGPSSEGYMMVTVTEACGGSRRIAVHLLVLWAYRGAPPGPGYEGAHDDGNKLNNAPSNLFWRTPKENGEDRVRHGTSSSSPRNSKRHATPEEKAAARAAVASGHSRGSVARKMGLSREQVSRASRGLPTEGSMFHGRPWQEAARDWAIADGVLLYEDALESAVRKIPGVELPYLVTVDGRILSWNRDRGIFAMSTAPNSNGYLAAHVKPEGNRGRTPRRVHVMVLEAFVGLRPSPDHDGAHDDGDKSNCRLSNLLWKARAANIQDKVRHGTQARGSRHGMAKLTEAQALEVIRAEATGEKTKLELASEFGIDVPTVGKICSGKLWKDLPRPAARTPIPQERVNGSRVGTSKLTDAAVLEMRSLYRPNGTGPTTYQLAERFGVDHITVGNIVAGRTWRHLLPEGAAPEIRRGNSKLSRAQRAEVRARNAAGETYAALGRAFGVNKNTVRLICLSG